MLIWIKEDNGVKADGKGFKTSSCWRNIDHHVRYAVVASNICQQYPLMIANESTLRNTY